MAPTPNMPGRPDHDWDGSWTYNLATEGYIVESWSQGFMFGALMVMACITVANMTSLLLHRLILIELILAMAHGTFCFMSFDGYGWYVSATATMLYSSWYLHNIIAWIKTKPFLSKWHSRIYIFSFLLTTPYWITETYANYAFNNNIDRLFLKSRPFEFLCRDPWWIFTALCLIYNLKKRYDFGIIKLIQTSPRFGIMLVSMLLSIIFGIVDVLSATGKLHQLPGINPYWKLSLVFKCLCDTIILDDFRSALDKIRKTFFGNVNNMNNNGSVPLNDRESSSRWRSKSRKHSGSALGNTVNIKSVPKTFEKQPGTNSGLRDMFGHSRLPSEDRDKIYVSTDISMSMEQGVDIDRHSSSTLRQERGY